MLFLNFGAYEGFEMHWPSEKEKKSKKDKKDKKEKKRKKKKERENDETIEVNKETENNEEFEPPINETHVEIEGKSENKLNSKSEVDNISNQL